MKKWHSFLQYMQFPLKLMFFATICLAVSSVLLNPIYGFETVMGNENIYLFSEALKYLGGFIYQIFPILVFIKLLSKKYEDSVPLFLGVFSYVLILIVMMFFAKEPYTSIYYQNTLGISSTLGEGTKLIPYNIGIFGLLAAYFVVSISYRNSRRYSVYGVSNFVDHDSYAMVIVIVLSFLAGLGFAYGWPYFLNVLNGIFTWIAQDITNPMNLMVYGMLERVLAILNLDTIQRSLFWFSELGGSWMDSFGAVVLGDVNIFMIQQNLTNVVSYAGRLITPYYIINMFMIPAFFFAYYSLVDAKKDRQRYALFFILAILMAIICNNPLPVELYMLFVAPVLYVAYILIVGSLFAILSIMDLTLGFNFTGNVISAMPGSGLELFWYLSYGNKVEVIVPILIIGFITAIIFFFLTRTYFKRYAIGLFELKSINKTIDNLIFALGGLDNIVEVKGTPDKLVVQLENSEYIDLDILDDLGAYLILESRNGYLIRLGNINVLAARGIRKRKKQAQALQEVTVE